MLLAPVVALVLTPLTLMAVAPMVQCGLTLPRHRAPLLLLLLRRRRRLRGFATAP